MLQYPARFIKFNTPIVINFDVDSIDYFVTGK